MKIHIGKKIREEVRKSDMTVSEFARKINYTRRNVYMIFEKETIDVGQLLKIGKVLDHDFLQYYLKEKEYQSISPHHQLSEINAEVAYYRNMNKKKNKKISDLKKEIQYLKEINELLKEKLQEKNTGSD